MLALLITYIEILVVDIVLCHAVAVIFNDNTISGRIKVTAHPAGF
jgi:hypothetical protein